jgi:hypothetical protein
MIFYIFIFAHLNDISVFFFFNFNLSKTRWFLHDKARSSVSNIILILITNYDDVLIIYCHYLSMIMN